MNYCRSSPVIDTISSVYKKPAIYRRSGLVAMLALAENAYDVF